MCVVSNNVFHAFYQLPLVFLKISDGTVLGEPRSKHLTLQSIAMISASTEKEKKALRTTFGLKPKPTITPLC